MKTRAKNHQAGFTLIEFIVALVVAAIIAAMVSTYFGTALTQSSVPIERLKSASNLHQVMENIVADYNRLNALNLRYKWRTGIPYHIGSVVVPPTSNGHFYTCTTAGTSGAGPASWLTGSGAVVYDGGATWREGGVISVIPPATVDETIVWQTSRSYSDKDIMIPIKNNGHYYRCTTAGTSSSSVPDIWTPSTVYSVGKIVVPTLFNGRNYRCTTAGTSGTTEPTWPTAPNSTVTEAGGPTWTEYPDGDYPSTATRWTEVDTILARNDATASNNEAVLNDNIYNYLGTSRYGTGYTVVTAETGFIKFSGTDMVYLDPTSTDEKNILKVTIKSNDSSETLMELFTIR